MDGETDSERHRLRVLNDMLRAGASSLNLTEVIDEVGEHLGRLFAFDRLSVVIVRPSEDHWVSYAFTTDSPGGRMRVPAGDSLARAAADGDPVLVPELAESPYESDQAIAKRAGLHAAMFVPLVAQDRVIGILAVSNRTPEAYDQGDLVAAAEVGRHLGVIVEHALLSETAQEQALLEERARLARDLHDGLANALAGLIWQLKEIAEADADGLVDRVATAEASARALLDETRRTLWDLQPLALETTGLSDAIDREISALQDRGIRATMDLDGEQPDSMDRRCSTALFRAAQESIANAARHGSPRRVLVALDFGLSEATLTVMDDGSGFDPDVQPAGLGLAGMQERMRLIGGRVEVRSAPGMGTRVMAAVPYQPSASPTPAPTIEVPEDTSHASVRVLIADGQELVRRGLRHMLDDAPGMVVVADAADGEGTLAAIVAHRPDVVLLDTQLPGIRAVEVLERLRTGETRPQVILMTVFDRDERVFDGLRAGARGYLLKDVSRDQVVRAIHTVRAGGSLLPPVATTRLLEQLDPEAPGALTPRELEVLQALATGARNKEIARTLFISTGTVKFHIGNVLRKLGAHTRTEAVMVARERGLLET